MIYENVIIRPKAQELAITVKQIARYSGGSRYRMNPGMQKKALPILKKASNLIEPALVYSVHEISHLKKEIRSKLLLPENMDHAPKLAVCICTLGPKLEAAVSEAMKSGDALHAVLLDSAGVGFLESLGALALSHIRNEAKKHHLHTGCRLGPGYNHVPIEAQVHLFSLTNPEGIGVSLMDSMVMNPAKSLSFYVIFYTHPHAESDIYKCATCDLANCPYRISPA